MTDGETEAQASRFPFPQNTTELRRWTPPHCSVIPVSRKYLSVGGVPGIVFGARDAALNKADQKNPPFGELTVWSGGGSANDGT